MGTWGIATFENDDAMDWLNELQEAEDVSLLASSLIAEEAEEYLEAPDGVRILCAAEVIAAAVSGASDGLPEEVLSWLEDRGNSELLPLAPQARAGVDRVLADRSELAELWEENPESYPVWRSSVERLRQRLGG